LFPLRLIPLTTRSLLKEIMPFVAELAKMDLVDVDEVAVESNIVLFHLKPEAPPVFEVLSYLKDAGIILGGMKGACHAPLRLLFRAHASLPVPQA